MDYKEQSIRIDKYDYNIILMLTDNETKVNKKHDINFRHGTSISNITRSLKKRSIYIVYNLEQIKENPADIILNDILYSIFQSCAMILSDNQAPITNQIDDCTIMSDEFDILISTVHFSCYKFLKEYLKF